VVPGLTYLDLRVAELRRRDLLAEAAGARVAGGTTRPGDRGARRATGVGALRAAASVALRLVARPAAEPAGLAR
jgi:hypothetical protein